MNRLADSLSPYLLQHKHNPVDWFPWGEEAFAVAKQTDRPIFLSIGYAACHWCHVMERESFEEESIARFLNDHFVSIKVDREERPDIDQIYMNAVQVMTGHGGWPMSVFLNHQREPFFAGTYWPAQSKFGMPSFPQVLDAIADAWKQRRDEVEHHAEQITSALRQLAGGSSQESDASIPDSSTIDDAVEHLLRTLDRRDGGFGGAPKFPHATDLNLLLQIGATRGAAACIEAVELTLDRMAAGGIRDHIGGGFARYSVDAKWLVPHFEKMLYDNALLAEVYLRAFQATGHDRHAGVARETLDYLCREMVDRDGGFHCSEDADSEGVEGKFYVWTPDAVSQVLGAERAERFCRVYDISEAGNFEGNSIPNLPGSLEQWAANFSMSEETLVGQLAEDRERLRLAREERVHPGRDDKVLAAWNSLAIKSLALGGAILEQPQYLEAAQRAAEFLFEKMTAEDGRLLHAFRDGQAHLSGYLDDYAYTIEACLALFEASGVPVWVQRAVKLAEQMLDHFEDASIGGFFYTADDAESLITRTKDWHDGSLVSGNASAAAGLLKLSRLVDRDDFRAAAERVFIAGADILKNQAAACGALLSALDRFRNDHSQLVLAVTNPQTQQQMRAAFLRPYRPHATLSWVVESLSDEVPIALNRERATVANRPTLFQCHDFTCDRPLVGDEVATWLQTASQG